MLDIPFNGGEVGTAGGAGEVGRSPEVIAPEFAPDLREVALAEQAGGDELERVHEAGDGQFGRITQRSPHKTARGVITASRKTARTSGLPMRGLRVGGKC